jgi:hypothetical protein
MALWTPADITTALWLDAADSSTLFDAVSGGSLVGNNGAVARWEDKSGNVRHATQATSGSRGTWNASGINGIGAISLDGNDFYSANSLASVFSGEDKPIAIFAVCKRSTADAQHAAWSFGRSLNVNPVVSIRSTDIAADGTSNKIRSTKRDDSAVSITKNSSTNWGTDTTAIAYIDSGISSEVWKDGAIAIANDTSDIGSITLDRFTIGLTWIATVQAHFFVGSVCDYIATASVPSVANRQRIEGYLAHKWGLTASLPSDHPYKNTPPGFVPVRRRRSRSGGGVL